MKENTSKHYDGLSTSIQDGDTSASVATIEGGDSHVSVHFKINGPHNQMGDNHAGAVAKAKNIIKLLEKEVVR